MDRTKVIYYEKDISEIVLRKSLYWLSADILWELEVENGRWKISFQESLASDTPLLKAKLDRLINDYQLRELLDFQTGALKQAIISKSLKDLSK